MEGSPYFTVTLGHGRVYIPRVMTELDVQMKGSNCSAISSACTTDHLMEVGMDYDESRKAVLELEKQKAATSALSKDLGLAIAGQTDIVEKVTAYEEFEKAMHCEDNTTADRIVPTCGPSMDKQCPAVQLHYAQSSSQLGIQSGNTEDPFLFSHCQPSPMPRQGGIIPKLGVGFAVMIPNISPPMYGTIRWIGTLPQVQGCVAGVELVSFTF